MNEEMYQLPRTVMNTILTEAQADRGACGLVFRDQEMHCQSSKDLPSDLLQQIALGHSDKVVAIYAQRETCLVCLPLLHDKFPGILCLVTDLNTKGVLALDAYRVQAEATERRLEAVTLDMV